MRSKRTIKHPPRDNVPHKTARGINTHWNKRNGRKFKPKRPFETEIEADEFILKFNLSDYVSYRCDVCGKWHIGHVK